MKSRNVICVEERETPGPREGEALVKVMACGLCGTDVHIFHGDKGAADNPFPIVLGHEFSGVVEEINVGGGVRPHVAIGDRVCVDPNVLCGRCEFCLGGIGHFCEGMTGIGTTVDGGFAEYCAVPLTQLYKIADDCTYGRAALAEPLSCCLHGIDGCDIRAGENAVVIGGGLIGLIMLQLARMRGAASVCLIEPVAEKRALAESLGADLTIDPFTRDAAQELWKNGIRRVSTVIECVGSVKTVEQAISLAGKKSVVMLFGLTKPEDSLSVKPFDFFKREITLRSSFINPYTMKRAVDLINGGKLELDSLISARLPLDGLGDALGNPDIRKSGKILITPWGGA